jgi:hypothetical protein
MKRNNIRWHGFEWKKGSLLSMFSRQIFCTSRSEMIKYIILPASCLIQLSASTRKGRICLNLMGTIGTVPSNAHSWHPVRNLSPAMGARNQVGIGLSYRHGSLCCLAAQFQTRFLESIPRPIAGLKIPTLLKNGVFLSMSWHHHGLVIYTDTKAFVGFLYSWGGGGGASYEAKTQTGG